jgi:hypothetical protein
VLEVLGQMTYLDDLIIADKMLREDFLNRAFGIFQNGRPYQMEKLMWILDNMICGKNKSVREQVW